jgi:hypothetical protein
MTLGGRRTLTWIAGIAVVLRLGAALYVGNEVTALPGIYDQLSYQALAERVVAGHGFTFAEGHWPATQAGEPTAHWSFSYTLFLAAVYAVAGVTPLLARVIQAIVVGILHTWLAYRVGRQVFGELAGLIGATFSAVYVYFVYYAAGLLTEAFYFVCVLWTLDVALRLSAPGAATRLRTWLELGIAVGLTCLLRQVFLLFVPVLFLWVMWAGRGGSLSLHARRIAPGLVMASVAMALLILPWTARNYRAFSTLVPINTNAGFALYWGNHPIHGTSFMPLLPEGETTYATLIPKDLRLLNEGQLDRALLRLAGATIAEDPIRFLRLSASRAREYFKFWPSAESSLLSNASRLLSFGLFLPLIIGGLMLGVRQLFHTASPISRSGVALLFLWIGTYSAIHLATWTLIRYRLPVDVVLILFAAFAASHLHQTMSSRRPAANETVTR